MNNLSPFLCSLSPQVSVYCIQNARLHTHTHIHTPCACHYAYPCTHTPGISQGCKLTGIFWITISVWNIQVTEQNSSFKTYSGFCNCFSQACDASHIPRVQDQTLHSPECSPFAEHERSAFVHNPPVSFQYGTLWNCTLSYYGTLWNRTKIKYWCLQQECFSSILSFTLLF